MESVAAANDWLLTATILSALLTGILIFVKAGKQKHDVESLSSALRSSRRQVKALEKAAEEIRKELLEIQQHQDINQIKLQSNQSSTQELQNALAEAQHRLKITEAALNERKIAEAALKKKRTATTTKGRSTGLSQELETVEDLMIDVQPAIGLSDDQQEQLIGLLDPGPKGNVDIFCIVDDENSETTARQLESILSSDGWKTNGVAKSAFTKPPKGVVLAVNSKDTAPSYASFLQRVFSTIGMIVSPKIDKKYREWSLTIIVGDIEN